MKIFFIDILVSFPTENNNREKKGKRDLEQESSLVNCNVE